MRFKINDIVKYQNFTGVTEYYLLTDYYPGAGFSLYNIREAKELDRCFSLEDREDYWFEKVEEKNVAN